MKAIFCIFLSKRVTKVFEFINFIYRKSRIVNPADFLYNCFMTSKITIQNKLKYIFSNNIIHNIDLLFKRAYFSNSHISFIKKSISNFIASRNLDKEYLLLKCFSYGHSHKIPLTYKSRLCPS